MLFAPILAKVNLVMSVVAVLFVLCAVGMILIILIQKGRGGGLSSAFGGGMAGGLLGSKTGDFLTWVTIIMVGVFLLLAVVMAKYYRPTVSGEYDVSPVPRPPTKAPVKQPTQPPPPGTGELSPARPQPTPATGPPGDVFVEPGVDAEPNSPGAN
jgi:preprotein translocase subunit SecG